MRSQNGICGETAFCVGDTRFLSKSVFACEYVSLYICKNIYLYINLHVHVNIKAVSLQVRFAL